MASLSDIANITVSTLTAAIKQAGFGLPLIADYHTKWSERVRIYNDLDAMTADGFAVTDAAYQAADAAFSQDPEIEAVAIGRRALAPTLQFDITPTAVNLKAYTVTCYLPNGTVTNVTYTSDGTATAAEVVAGLVSAINAIASAPLTATDLASGHVTVRVVSAVPGQYFALKVADKALMSIKATGADPGIATDLAAMRLENGDFYGVSLTTQGAAEIQAAAVWVEADKSLMLQATQDGDIIAAGSSDIASTLAGLNLSRTALLFASDPTQHAGSAWLGKGFPIDPGGLTFANLTLAAVSTEPLTGTNITQLKAKKCNYFTSYGGIALTRNGVVSSGEYIDIIRDRDWYQNQLQVECLAVMVNNRKVPMTDRGIAQLENAVRVATKRAIDAGFLAEGTDSYVVPKAADISANDRANRTLGSSPIRVSARVAGAIHLAQIRATITS